MAVGGGGGRHGGYKKQNLISAAEVSLEWIDVREKKKIKQTSKQNKKDGKVALTLIRVGILLPGFAWLCTSMIHILPGSR